MVKYQIQYKEETPEMSLCNLSNQNIEDQLNCFLRQDLRKQKSMISEYSNGGHWRVVAEHHSLQSAIKECKALLRKYGYQQLQICKVTSLNIDVYAQ